MVLFKSMNNEGIAVIIPVFNEGKVIEGVINDVLNTYKTVICVNDGSSDDSAEKIQKTNAVFVNHPINMGQGAALQTGLDFALQDKRNNYFVTFDADGQHRVEDVAKMLETMKRKKVDIALGSRFMGEVENIWWLKKMILKSAIMFSNTISGLKLTDTHNGLRVMNRRAASCMQLRMSDYSHASEIIERIVEKKLKYAEVPVKIVYTEYSMSKGQSLINAINIAFDMLIHKVSGR